MASVWGRLWQAIQRLFSKVRRRKPEPPWQRPPVPPNYRPPVPAKPDVRVRNEWSCRMLNACQAAYSVTQTGKLKSDFSKDLGRILEGFGSAGGDVAATPAANLGDLDAGFVALFPHQAVIAFRGTLAFKPNSDKLLDLLDWVQDAKAEPVDAKELGHVHHGFWSSVEAVLPKIDETLAQWEKAGKLRGKKLYVTGHSKGGAMAYLAAAKIHARALKSNRVKVDAVYTFAAPRPGLDDFAKAYAEMGIETHRYENADDIVPHLPPSADEAGVFMKSGGVLARELIAEDKYASVGSLIYIQPDKRVVQPNADQEREFAIQRAEHAAKTLQRLTELEQFVKELGPNHSIDKGSRYRLTACVT